MKTKVHRKTYEIKNSESPVLLSITIGNYQKAVTKIYKQKKLIDVKNGSIENYSCGKNSELFGVKLDFDTVIQDVNKDTNEMTCQVELAGGIKKFKPKKDVYAGEKHFDFFTIRGHFTFI